MSNPIILIQMLKQYMLYNADGPRTFRFAKNNRLKIHKETEEETSKRKSLLTEDIRKAAENAVREQLRNALHGRMGKVWTDDPEKLKRLGIALQNSVSESGYGVMPAGTRVPIPEGKKIRAFTYWEKVSDIDLSCFGIKANGEKEEFSWRSMWHKQNDAITFSGDQTSGYNGGSEYFDIDLDELKKNSPDWDYLVFCDNIFSSGGRIHYKDILATAGFMVRDRHDTGEVFEPKTVETSFRLTTDSSFCYMFGIDIKTREMVWLNIAREGDTAVAGTTEMGFLRDYLDSAKIFSVYDLITYAGEIVKDIKEADWIFSDNADPSAPERKERVIRSWDTEKILSFIQPD